jgi:glutamyl-tRNA reductase
VSRASQASRGTVVALITHAREVPAIERERFATRLRATLSGQGLVLETCHRVEGYITSRDDPPRLSAATSLPQGGRLASGEAAIRHAIAVAVGRDSVVIGEDQVLHQVREMLGSARGALSVDPALERLFSVALQAGRRARSWRQGPRRSLADVALSAIEHQTGPLGGREILVVGAGKMGRLAATAAVAAGASVSIANRSADGARSVAAATGARLEAVDPGRRAGAFAGVIVALAGPWAIAADSIDALAASKAIVVDLSVPAAVPQGAVVALGPRFVSADTLALAGPGHAAVEDGSARRVDALVDRTTAEFLDWLSGGDARAAAQALLRRADREREAELAALWRRLPDLDPDVREGIEAMTRHLARRLLREPLERLGRDADGRDERAVRDIFAL